jgi:prepilin-type processing-associated H-X9-DG protein
MRGFETAAALLSRELKAPAEKRGFGEAKLLTHWPEIVGEDLAAIARPVKITYGRGFGGTLVVLTTGANAPVLEMQKERIVERVNATYGYRAVAHVHITQTAPTGFADGHVAFRPQTPKPAPKPDPARLARALQGMDGIEDAGLKQALARLAENVLTPRKP